MTVSKSGIPSRKRGGADGMWFHFSNRAPRYTHAAHEGAGDVGKWRKLLLEKTVLKIQGWEGGTIERLSRKCIGIFEDGMGDGTPAVSK